MTFKEVKIMFEDIDNWRLIPNDSAATAIYKEKYLVYLKFAVTIWEWKGYKKIFEFNPYQFLIIKFFYRRSLRKYLERKFSK